MKDFKPGNVLIDECSLTSKDGQRSYDIRRQARHIDIYESILQPMIYGEIIVADSIGLLRGFPILGEETLHIKFRTPTLTVIDLKLSVYSISNIEPSDNNKLNMYTLKLCSPELLTNATQLMNKRYKNQISTTIRNIVSTELKSKKTIQVEATRGIDDHLISHLTPMETIDKFRHRAVSPTNASSSYLFFENPQGYHFKTLEGLIRAGKTKVADKVFFHDDNLDIKVSQIRFRDILDYKEIVDQDSIEKLHSGSFLNVVNKFDILTGNLKKVIYKNELFENVFVNTADTPKNNTAAFKNEHGKTPARQFLVPFSSEHDEDYIGEKVGILHAFVEKVVQNIMIMLIYGDSSITIGDVITCSFSLVNGLTGTAGSKQVTNNYLVSMVRHQITLFDRPVYLQSLQLLNSSLAY